MINRSGLSLISISALLVVTPLHGQSVCTTPWTLEETLRIGSLDGDDALSSVMDLEIGPEGEIYVAQLFVPQVTVFTADGRLSHTIGRAGTGPGEFDGWAVRLGWIQDTLWVTDLSAMNFFSPDGSEVRQVFFSTRLSNEGSRFQPGTPLQDGSFLGRRGLRGNIAAFLAANRLSVPRFSASGEILDTIAWGKQRLIVQTGSGAFVHHPLDDLIGLAAVPMAATHDGSAVILLGEVRDRGRSPSFDLLRLGITGDTLSRRAIPYEPKPVPRAERRWLTEVFGNNMAGDYSSGPNGLQRDDATKERQRRDWRQAITFPDYHPPVRRIVTGKDGSIWLLRELSMPDLVDRWEVYDEDGELQGVVLVSDGKASPIPWQPRLNILRATRDEVWGTTIDDFEVPYIHRYRVNNNCQEAT